MVDITSRGRPEWSQGNKLNYRCNTLNRALRSAYMGKIEFMVYWLQTNELKTRNHQIFINRAHTATLIRRLHVLITLLILSLKLTLICLACSASFVKTVVKNTEVARVSSRFFPTLTVIRRNKESYMTILRDIQARIDVHAAYLRTCAPLKNWDKPAKMEFQCLKLRHRSMMNGETKTDCHALTYRECNDL